MEINQLSRKDLIELIKERQIDTPKPPHMMKTEDLLPFLKKIGKKKEKGPRKNSKRALIYQYMDEGKTTGFIIDNVDAHPAYVVNTIMSRLRVEAQQQEEEANATKDQDTEQTPELAVAAE